MSDTAVLDSINRIDRQMEEYRKDMRSHSKDLLKVSETVIRLEESSKTQSEAIKDVLVAIKNDKKEIDTHIDNLRNRQNKIMVWLTFAAGMGYVLFNKGSTFFKSIFF